MTAAWIFAALSAGCLALFVYPYVLYPAVLRLLAKRPVRRGKADPSMALLFCAYNEIESLPAKLDNLREIKSYRPDLQILAYDDGSTDGTFELLSSASDILTVERGPGRTGKAAGMKRLARLALGDILVFTDANVLLAPNALDRLAAYYSDIEIGGVCGTLQYLTDPGSVTADVGSLYWRLDEKLRTLESETGNVMGADGSIFSIRRSLYPDFPDTVLDDLTVSMSVIFQGKRLVKAPDVIAYEKSVAQRHEELRRKIRIGARAYHTHLYLLPQLRRMAARDRFKYASRKLIRWFGGPLLVVGALSGIIGVLLFSWQAGLALIATTAILLLLMTRSRAGRLAKVGEILLATLATFVGVSQAMRGRTVVTWAPAKSR